MTTRKQELVLACTPIHITTGDSGLHCQVGTYGATGRAKDKVQYDIWISSFPSTLVGQLTTTCKSSSRGSDDLCWPLLTRHSRVQAHTQLHLYTHIPTKHTFTQKHKHAYTYSHNSRNTTHSHTNLSLYLYTDTHIHKHTDMIVTHINTHANTYM